MKKLLVLLFIFSAWQGFSQIDNNSTCDMNFTFYGTTAACQEVCKTTICVSAGITGVPFPTACGDAWDVWDYVLVCPANSCTSCGIPSDCKALGIVNCQSTPMPTGFTSANAPAPCTCGTFSGSSNATSITIN